MLTFNEPEITDRQWASKALAHAKNFNCEYAFGALYMWRKSYRTYIANYEDSVIFRWGKQHVYYSVPIGTCDFKRGIDEIFEDAKTLGIQPKIYGITDVYKDILEDIYPNQFEYVADDASFDYVYLSKDLAFLSGKKYHSKRNHISNFIKNNPDWKYEDINEKNIDECLQMHRSWISNKDADNTDYANEYIAAKSALDNFKLLDLKGGLIRVQSQIVAYTFGERLNDECFVCHIEKAPADMQGAYAIINREFARRIYDDGYKYINREEDLGIAGLRKAKQSYHPVIWLKKEIAKYRDKKDQH